jgi:hypothetical protein
LLALTLPDALPACNASISIVCADERPTTVSQDRAGAKDEAARAFYRKYGFIEFPKIDKRLFLPMGTIEKLFAGQQVAKAL